MQHLEQVPLKRLLSFVVTIALALGALVAAPVAAGASTPPNAAPAAAPAAVPVPGSGEAVITVQVGGPRASRSEVGPLAGVTLELYNGGSSGPSTPVGSSWARCTSDADGDCSFVVPNTGSGGANLDRRFWVVRAGTPGGYYSLDTLVTGRNGGRFRLSQYRFRTSSRLRSGNTYTSTQDFMIGTGNTNDTASGGIWQVSRNNPAIPAKCGLDVALVVDVSGSVGSALPQLKQAAKTFTNSLVGTPSQVGLFTFAANAPANNSNNRNRPLTAVSSQDGANQVNRWVDGLTSGGSTNWDRGLYQVAESSTDYDIAVVITDGNPTVYGGPPAQGPASYTRFREIEEGVFSANAVKAKGTRVLAFGVGAGLGSNPQNLQSISGLTRDSDYFQTSDYGQAGDILRELALGNCRSSVSVLKWEVPSTAAPGSIAGAELAGGWTFGATSSTPGVTVDPGSGVTDAATGAVSFDVAIPGGTSSAAVTVTETQQPGFTLVQRNGANAECRRLDTNAPLGVVNSGSLGFTVQGSPAYGISCNVYNRAPSPLASVTVDKNWVVNGTAYADGDQPVDLEAGLIIDGQDRAFGQELDGYQQGEQVRIDETTDIGLRQCTLVSSRVTRANGQTVDVGLPYQPTLNAGSNNYTITNEVACETRLTLAKEVEGGNVAPNLWDLTANAPQGALPGPTGKDGVTADVTPDVRYLLSESGGDPRYTQYVDPNATITPPATGSWDCQEVDLVNGDITVIPGFQDGLNGGVNVPIGTWVRCQATNETAQVTLLKDVTNDDGGKAVPGDWQLTATPTGNPPAGLGAETVSGSDRQSAANTFIVRPGQQYRLTESGPGGYDLDSIRCVIDAPGTGNDRTQVGEDLTLDAADEAVCTFVNDDLPATIELDKAADVRSVDRVGDPITYTFTATNTGDVPLTDVSVSDPLSGLSALSCNRPAPVTLDPGEFLRCTASYKATQADIDAGLVDNTATATGTPAGRDPVTDSATENVPAPQNPDIALTKTADRSSVSQRGETITYSFTATNTGNTSLSGVRITDPLTGLSPLTCTPGQPTTLAAGDSLTCTATYDVTQADLDAGAVANTGTVTGNPPSGQPVTATDPETVPATQDVSIGLTKTASPTTVTAAGEQVTYTFSAVNDGNVSLSDVTIADPLTGLSPLTCAPGQPATLTPGATLSCTATYTVTQGDIDRGQIENTATASGTGPGGSTPQDRDTATVQVDGRPGIVLDKVADVSEITAAGDVITYTFTATNTGNVSLSDVAVADPLPGLSALSCDRPAPVTLAPNETLTCTAKYAATQADVDAGAVSNLGTVTGAPPTGPPVTSTDPETVPAARTGAIDLQKTANRTTVNAVGNVVDYTFVATNTGNVSLSGVTIADPLPGLSALTCDRTSPVTLAPAAKLTCTATYRVTQADLDAGDIKNTATASGRPPTGGAVTATDEWDVTTVDSPSISLTKTPSPNSVDRAGEQVSYTFVATNTGNVTLTDVGITDPLPGLSALTCNPVQPATLAPGGSIRCTATYRVIQADMNAGGIDNTATATGTPPRSEPVTATADARVTANQVPDIDVAKVANKTSVSADGETVEYTFTATNTGNVALSDVQIDDPLPGLSALNCTPGQPADLAPGAQLTCAATYSVTQADLDRGAVENVATATGTPPTGPDVSATATERVPAIQREAIDLVKVSDVQSVSSVGETVTYTFTAENTGNVTLTDVTIDDPLPGLSGLTCDLAAPVTLTPGTVLTCSAAYATKQADLDAGAIINTATATGTPPAGPDATDRDQQTVPTDQGPRITLTKTADQASFNTAGAELNYTLTATNSGNVTLTGVRVSDTRIGSAGLQCFRGQVGGPGVTLPTTLAPGTALVCRGNLQTTQADLDAGAAVNTATATGTPPTGPDVNDTDTARVPAEQKADLTLTKAADKGSVSTVGEQVTYTFTARNAGNVTLGAVEITDPLQGLSTLVCRDPDAQGTPAVTQPTTLSPGQRLRCTATYSVTQTDLNTGRIDNTATATAQPPTGAPVTTTDDAVVDVAQTPSIRLTKAADKGSVSTVGERVTYTFTATNTGNVNLSDVSIDDPLVGLSALSCAPNQPADLAPGGALTCAAEYPVSQADLDRGAISNTATATGTPPSGGPVKDEATQRVPTARTPALTLDKTADKTQVSTVGEKIEYTFTARNEGNVTLTGVRVDDPLNGLSPLGCVPGQSSTLVPGAELTCTAEYVVTQADLDAGAISNTATATGTPPTGPDVPAQDSETVPASQTGALQLVKAADKALVSRLDEPITYTFTVRNNGNVTLRDVQVTDPLPGLSALSCTPNQPIDLAPGAGLTCTGDYRVTQNDLDRGSIQNTATVTGRAPDGRTVTDKDAQDVAVDQQPSISLDKTAAGGPVDTVGDVVTYTFAATNTGNVTLTGVSVSDPLQGLSAPVCDQATPASLAPAATLTCTATYSVTQADLNAGGITNTATAAGTPPAGPDVTAQDPEVVPASQTAALKVTKTSGSASVSQVGERVTYTFVASNVGNVTLTDVEITDPLPGLSALSCDRTAPVTLDPGQRLTCTATYTVTQTDIDQGAITNLATATGTTPAGRPIPAKDAEAVPATQVGDISLTKTADKQSVSTVGEAITYTFITTNAGNVTLTDVTIADPLQGLSALTCVDPDAQGTPTVTQPASLSPGQRLRCTATYPVAQADLDAGSVVNSATVSGTPPAGPAVGATDDETVPAVQAPSITFAKTADQSSFDAAGAELDYTLTATNNGNVTLTGVTIADSRIASLQCFRGQVGGADVTLPTTLAPGASVACRGSLRTSQSDLDAGALTNTATASGTPPKGPDVRDTDTETVPADRRGDIDLVKSAAPAAVSTAGETITYTFTATNVGNVTLTGVEITDPLPGLSALRCDTAAPVSLDPGVTLTCTADYSVTQQDLDAGGIANTAVATGSPPTGPDVTDTGSETVPVLSGGAIDLVKSADKSSVSAPGETITYTFTATNVGNVTLTGVRITDPLSGLSALSCDSAAPVSLAPRAKLSCTADYTVTQSDIDAGQVTNTATATGTPPTGTDVTDTGSSAVPAERRPGISVVKTADPAGPVKRGTRVTYSYTVTNTGNTTLTDVRVTDDKCSPVSGPIGAGPDGRLRPGQAWAFECSDTLRASTTNTAVASAREPGGSRVESTDTARVRVSKVKRRACPITVVVKKPRPKRVGNRLLVKRIKTNKKCKRLKPIVVCRPLGRASSGEKAFCRTVVTKRGRVRVKVRGLDAVRVTVVVRARPKRGQRDAWKPNTWRRSWVLRKK